MKKTKNNNRKKKNEDIYLWEGGGGDSYQKKAEMEWPNRQERGASLQSPQKAPLLHPHIHRLQAKVASLGILLQFDLYQRDWLELPSFWRRHPSLSLPHLPSLLLCTHPPTHLTFIIKLNIPYIHTHIPCHGVRRPVPLVDDGLGRRRG